MATEQSKIPPPYMSYGVFKSTIDTLAEATVPTGPLDRRVLDGLSGADHSALISGLRFLGYVDEERRATESYRQLVAGSKEPTKFKSLLMETINDKYDDVVGSLDMQGGTAAEVEKTFREYGVPSGQMLTKTIRFYVKALSECGVPISPHITKAKPRTPRNGTKKPDKAIPKGTLAQSGREHITPKGFERMPVPGLPDAFVQFPLNLTEAHCDLFDSVVRVLRTFAKGRSGGKENVA